MTKLLSCVFLLTVFNSTDLWSQNTGEYNLAANRSDVAVVIDPVTLATVARIHFDFRMERATVEVGGSSLNVHGYTNGNSCCAQ